MSFLTVFGHAVSDWLGLETTLPLDAGPIEFELEAGSSVWLVPDPHADRLTLSCALNNPFTIDAQRAAFILELSSPSLNDAGLAIGADSESALVSVSRRFDARALDRAFFELSVRTLAAFSHRLAEAVEVMDEAPVFELLNAFAIDSPQSEANPCATLADALADAGIAYERLLGEMIYVPLEQAVVLCRNCGEELLFSAVCDSEPALESVTQLHNTALLRNLFLGRCTSAGYYLDEEGKPGAFAFQMLGDDPVRALQQAATRVIGDLHALLEDVRPALKPHDIKTSAGMLRV